MGLIRHIPLPIRLPLIRAASAMLAAVRLSGEARPCPVSELRPGPLVVEGFLDEVLGVGVAGRMTAQALEAAGFGMKRRSLRPALKRAWFGARPGVAERPGGVWLIHANAPEALMALMAHDRADWEGRYRIGYWAWETTEAPESWARAVGWFHEVWVPSRFVAEAVGAALDRIGLSDQRARLRVMPHPVRAPQGVAARPERFGLDPRRRHALVMFDGRSAFARKNPWAAIEAWTRAFPTPREDLRLVIKGLNLSTDPASGARLKALAAARPDVILSEEALEPAEMWDLLASIDLVVSMHRAEGFGLVPAEAMALGKAVIMTGWSAPTEFADEDSAVLLPYRLVPVEDPTGAYAQGQWADPDIDACARAIAALIDDPQRCAEMGARAQARIAALSDCWTAEALGVLPFAALIDNSAMRPAS